jgi:hypothetical protein
MTTPTQPRARLGFFMVIAGLVAQIAAALFWGPAMFIFSAAVGLPLVLAGSAVVFFTVRGVRASAQSDGPGPGPHAPA